MSDLDDLIEFLLARIAATEESAPYVFAEDFTPARVLAECEAKRRIISMLTAWNPDSAPDERVETSEHDAWRMLCALASVYADHPDYRKEWAL